LALECWPVFQYEVAWDSNDNKEECEHD
jgi:hypothetical protein